MDKKQRALEISEELLLEIESRKIDDHSVILKCLSIARLISDMDSVEWLQYELGGYPRTESDYIEPNAWNIGEKHGRCYMSDGKKYMFSELASEIISKVESSKLAIRNFTTSGVSTSGDHALTAMSKLTNTVTNNTNNLRDTIETKTKRLSILRSQYYDYALKVNIELSFSNRVTSIFNLYKEDVDLKMLEISGDTVKKLQAIETALDSSNPEVYSQALTTCRRLFEDIANILFAKLFPDYKEKFFRTKSGKEISVGEGNYQNRLSAVIEVLQEQSINKTLIGSSVFFTIDWIENLCKLQHKGVHADITKDEALRCVIHTYICLGDILKLVN